MVPRQSSSEAPQPNASERTSAPRLEPRVAPVASSLRQQPSAIPQLALVARTSATQLPLPSTSTSAASSSAEQSSPASALPQSPRPGGPGGHFAPPDLLASASRSSSSFGSASSTPTPGSPAISSTASRLLARATHKPQTAPPLLSQIPVAPPLSQTSKIPTGPPVRSAPPPILPPPPLPQPVQQPLVETPANPPPTVIPVPVRKISTAERPTGLKLPTAHLPPPSSLPKPPSLNLTVETAALLRATTPETAAVPGVPSRTATLPPPTVSNAPAALAPNPSTPVFALPAVAGSKLPLPASSTDTTANYEYLDKLESSPRAARAEPLLTRRSVSVASGPSVTALTGASNPLPLTSVAKSRIERRGSSRRAPRQPISAGGVSGGGAEDDVEISSCSSSEVDEEELGSVANASLLASLDNMSLHMTLSSTRDTGTSGARPSSPRRRHSAFTAHSHGGTHAEAPVPPPTVSANVPTPTSANANANAVCVQSGLEHEPELEPVLENETVTVHVSVPPITESAVNDAQADSSEQCPQPLCISSNNTRPLPPPPAVPTRKLPPPPPAPPRPPRAALASNSSVIAPATTTIRSEGKSLMQRSFCLHDHLKNFAWVLRVSLWLLRILLWLLLCFYSLSLFIQYTLSCTVLIIIHYYKH